MTDIAKGAKKAADNITPDLSELPNPGQLAAKVAHSAPAHAWYTLHDKQGSCVGSVCGCRCRMQQSIITIGGLIAFDQ